MTRRELDVLLAGSGGVTLTLSTGAQVQLGRNELLRPDDFARAFWNQVGHPSAGAEASADMTKSWPRLFALPARVSCL